MDFTESKKGECVMRFKNILKNNKGFSLIELAIAVTLLSILVGAVVVGGGMTTKMKISHESDTVNTLLTAAKNYLNASQTTYTGVSVAVLQGTGGTTPVYLPTTFNAATGNSWGGAYTVAADATPTNVDISVVGVPDAQTAALLTANFSSQATCSYTAASKTWTAIF